MPAAGSDRPVVGQGRVLTAGPRPGRSGRRDPFLAVDKLRVTYLCERARVRTARIWVMRAQRWRCRDLGEWIWLALCCAGGPSR
jgi:hypothetical protein